MNLTKEKRKDAIDYINGQLENGYLDLSSYDEDALEVIKEAMELLSIVDKWNNITYKYFVDREEEITKEEFDALWQKNQ